MQKQCELNSKTAQSQNDTNCATQSFKLESQLVFYVEQMSPCLDWWLFPLLFKNKLFPYVEIVLERE